MKPSKILTSISFEIKDAFPINAYGLENTLKLSLYRNTS